MPPLPKRKFSKGRTRRKRMHWVLKTPTATRCPYCHEPKLTHRACPSCGRYKDKKKS